MTDDRKTEIEAALFMITGICNSTEIALIGKQHQGINYVAVLDKQSGKEYALTRKETEQC